MASLISWVRKHQAITAATILLLLVLVFLRSALFPAPGQALGTHDTGALFAPWFESVRQSIRAGQLPYWDPYQFAGYPFLSNPQVAFFYPPTWLAFIVPANVAISWHVLLHLLLSALGMFLLARSMGGSFLGSMLAAVTYGFSGFVAARLWAGHIGLVATFAWLPWVILAWQWSVERRSIWSAIVAGLPFGLAILAGHIPSVLYICLIWLAFVVFDLITGDHGRRLLIRQTLIMLFVGFGLAAVQLLPFAQIGLASQRLSASDYDFATAFSLPPAHLVTLLLPEFFGEPTRIGYWSVPTFEELTYYAGLVAILGIVLALRKPTPRTWFYLALMVLGLWMAMGSDSALYRLAYDTVPVVRLLRAPARSAVLYLFAAAVLLSHAMSTWEKTPAERRAGQLRPVMKGALLVVLLAGVLAIAATGAVFMAVHPTETSGRLWHQIGGYLVATVILALAVGLIWALFSTPADMARRRFLLAVALVTLVVADLWHLGAKLIVLDDIGPDQMWQDARSVIGDTESLVLPWGVSIFDQSGSSQVGLRSAFGYQALEPGALVDFTGHVPDPRSSAYDILATRYVVAPVELNQFTEGDAGLEFVARQGDAWIYQRPNSLEVARLANRVEVFAEDSLAIERVHQPDFQLADTVILDREPDCDLQSSEFASGKATIELAEPDYWRISTHSDAPSVLVLAESYFPGWRAFVDGQPAETYRAYTTLRAVCVPGGEHVIEWQYRPVLFVIGGTVSLLSLLLVCFAAIKLRRHGSRSAASLSPPDAAV